MPRLRRSRPARLVVLGFAGALTVSLAACSRPPVEAEPAPSATSTACTQVATAWPATLRGKDPYPVSTPSDAVRAWGDRPESSVIARCGVTLPGPTRDTCFSADGVDWVQAALSDGVKYVTYGRSPAIEVLIPFKANMDGSSLAAFSSAAKKIPQGPHHCS